MPAVSKAQEHLFAMAKAVRKGALSKKEAGKKATELADSDISTKDLTDFARTKTKNLPKHVQKEEKMIQLTKEQYTKLIEDTKRKAINEAYDDAVDKEEVQNIVDNFKPVADKIEHNEASNYFGVRLSDESGNSDLKFWMDVSINTEYNDVDIDWNQYIFNLTNSNDLLRRAIQNDADMFDKCSGEAVYALEKAGKIYQSDDASWHVGNGQPSEPVKEDVNRGYLTGGGTPKTEPNKEELEAVRKAYADMKAKGTVPAFIAYQLPDKFEACANYATAAEYKKQGYKIARCQSGSVTESKKRSLKEISTDAIRNAHLKAKEEFWNAKRSGDEEMAKKRFRQCGTFYGATPEGKKFQTWNKAISELPLYNTTHNDYAVKYGIDNDMMEYRGYTVSKDTLIANMKNPDNPTSEDIKNAFIKSVGDIRNIQNIRSKYQAEYENACDYLYYGYGFSRWYEYSKNNGSEMSDKEAKLIWRAAFNKMANSD